MENKVIEIYDTIGVEPKSADFEDCHRVGKSKNNSKKFKATFANRKVVKSVLYKRKQLKAIDKTSIGLQNATIFLNENLTLENNKIAYHCGKLNRVMFPDINFSNNDNGYPGDPAKESLQSSY